MKIVRNKGRADRVIEWIERLKLSDGERAGQPYRLGEFHKQFIRDIYEPEYEDGRLVTQRGVFSVGRKNGKSQLAAALVLCSLIGPECEPGGSIISAATTRDQARIVFDAVVAFLNATPSLMKYVGVTDTKSTVFVRHGMSRKAAGSKYRAIASKPGAALGLNPSLIIFDELMAAGQNRKFFDALASAQKARTQPFLMVISTQAPDDEDVLSTLIDSGLARRPDADPACGCNPLKSCLRCCFNPSRVVHLYTAPAACDLTDPEAHRAANPAIGQWLRPDDFMTEAEEARRTPAEEAQFRLYSLNQRVSLNSPVITRAVWSACAMPGPAAPAVRKQTTFQFDKGERLYGGLDLSWKTDLTALVMISDEDPARCKSWFWKPKSAIDDHGLRDSVRYDLHAQNGWLIASDRETIDPDEVSEMIIGLARRYDIAGLAYDRLRMEELLSAFERQHFAVQKGSGPGLRIEPWGQQFPGMTPAVEALERAIFNGAFHHDGNPILTTHMANAAVRQDPSGAPLRKIVKLAAKQRVDGAIALAMALGLRAVDRTTAPPVSPWDDPNFTLKRPRP